MIEGRFVDLSHTLLPGKEEYKLELETYDTTELYPQYEKDRETWYILQEMHMFSHCGTHIEFPYHHNKNGMDASRFPLERLITDTVLLDYSYKKPMESVTLEELRRDGAGIRQGDSVMFRFGCDVLYRTDRSHDRPMITTDAIRWLIEEKRINLIGTDASGIEVKGVKNQPNHQLLMDHEIPIIEFAANLGDLRQERFVMFVLALSVIGLDSCPVRLLALERKGEST
jgi:arylformamidase